MTFSIRAIIRDLVAPKHQLSCPKTVWDQGLAELHRRGNGVRESGAFLVGKVENGKRYVARFIYYDDLDPHCLDSGIVIFNGSCYGLLWSFCRETRLEVVADIHTHPGAPIQSGADRENPMVATRGHIALIVPEFARQIVSARDLGIYQYLGSHKWQNFNRQQASEFFYIGRWG